VVESSGAVSSLLTSAKVGLASLLLQDREYGYQLLNVAVIYVFPRKLLS